MLIAVVPNRIKTENDELAQTVSQRLSQQGADVRVVFSDNGLPTTAQLTEALSGCNAAVVIGGDGTIMHVAKAAAAVGCPVLGINGGHLGFLAGVERDELDCLDRLVRGDYAVEERALLQVTVHTGDGDKTCLAMNEAMLSRGGLSRLVDVRITAGETELLTCRGDGVIVATPTGSTAYSLSAGGPVVDPQVACLLLTPVCPHSFNSRPRILPMDTVLTVQATAEDGRVYITVDGEASIPLTPTDRVTICRAADTARLIRLNSTTFYEVLQEKLAGRR